MRGKVQLGTFAGRMAYARRCNRFTIKLTVKYLSRTAGWTEGLLKSWENGTRSAPLDAVIYLARLYAVPLNWLLYGEGDVPIQPPVELTELEKLLAQTYGGIRARPETVISARARGQRPKAKWVGRKGS